MKFALNSEMARFVDKYTMEQMKVPGVVLMAGGENNGAIRFYSRIGFKMLLHTKITAVMAIDLTK